MQLVTSPLPKLVLWAQSGVSPFSVFSLALLLPHLVDHLCLTSVEEEWGRGLRGQLGCD